MPDPAHRAHGPEAEFDSVLGRVHALGREVLAAHAGDVDRDARFPREAVTALRRAKLLSSLVPRDRGGLGLTVAQVARVCDALGQYCGSSAMIFAMHQIQVACIVRHASTYPSDCIISIVLRAMSRPLSQIMPRIQAGMGDGSSRSPGASALKSPARRWNANACCSRIS